MEMGWDLIGWDGLKLVDGRVLWMPLPQLPHVACVLHWQFPVPVSFRFLFADPFLPPFYPFLYFLFLLLYPFFWCWPHSLARFAGWVRFLGTAFIVYATVSSFRFSFAPSFSNLHPIPPTDFPFYVCRCLPCISVRLPYLLSFRIVSMTFDSEQISWATPPLNCPPKINPFLQLSGEIRGVCSDHSLLPTGKKFNEFVFKGLLWLL